jgi:uncharacterized protein
MEFRDLRLVKSKNDKNSTFLTCRQAGIIQHLKFALACSLTLFLFITAFAQQPIPDLWGQRVHDEAHVLKQETIDRLENDLKSYEDSTSNQIAILIIKNLNEENIEDYSLKVVEKWKLGTKSKDNGALLLIAIDDHKMRIEVGHGLEGVLTDAQSNRIIRNEMAPNFRRSDYDAGVLAAISAMKSAIGGEYTADEADEHTNDFESMGWGTKILIGSIIFIFLGIFASIGLFSEGAMAWVLYIFLIPFYAGFMGLLISWWVFLGYLIVYPILRLLITKSGKKLMKWQSSGGGGSYSSGSSWSSGGGNWSGSSGGSSFSGGGGSFGGGGSSGSW